MVKLAQRSKQNRTDGIQTPWLVASTYYLYRETKCRYFDLACGIIKYAIHNIVCSIAVFGDQVFAR